MTTTEQFITHVKFQELHAQRNQARAAYTALEQRLREVPHERERLQLLYTGLRHLQFAQQPIHPNVANLDVLLDAHDQATTETLGFWQQQLMNELQSGKLRAEMVYVFGGLLQEQASEQTSMNAAGAPGPTDELVASVLQPSATPDLDAIDALLDATGLTGSDLVADTLKAIDATVYARIESHDVAAVLRQISDDQYRDAAVRREALALVERELLIKELADALTLALGQLANWDWPEGGIPAHARWARTKWRLFVHEDIPTAALLEILGNRWQRVIDSIFGQQEARRIARLRRLLDLNAPEIIVAAEREHVRAGRGTFVRGIDIWAEPAAHGGHTMMAADTVDQRVAAWGERGSIVEQRAALYGTLREWDRFGGYGGTSYTGGMDVALRHLQAELELARAAFPDRPVYVMKTDLHAFYPTLPHSVLLHILERLGVPERELAFFRHFLATRIAHSGAVQSAQQGVPNHRRLSDALGELVLRLLDQAVQQHARVHIIRLVDDLCLIAPSAEEAVAAWQGLVEASAACGLALNPEKCGAVTICGELPDALPEALPAWLLLQLHPDGTWQINERAFTTSLSQAREQLRTTTSTLARVELYNAYITYLTQALGCSVDLGTVHREQIGAALRRVQQHFFSTGHGIADGLRQ